MAMGGAFRRLAVNCGKNAVALGKDIGKDVVIGQALDAFNLSTENASKISSMRSVSKGGKSALVSEIITMGVNSLIAAHTNTTSTAQTTSPSSFAAHQSFMNLQQSTAAPSNTSFSPSNGKMFNTQFLRNFDTPLMSSMMRDLNLSSRDVDIAADTRLESLQTKTFLNSFNAKSTASPFLKKESPSTTIEPKIESEQTAPSKPRKP